MSLYLLHRSVNGEPVGIWDKMGRSVYLKEEFKPQAQSLIDTKSENVTWASFVDKLMHYTNFREWWEGIESNRSLKAVLDDARDEYVTEEMGR